MGLTSQRRQKQNGRRESIASGNNAVRRVIAGGNITVSNHGIALPEDTEYIAAVTVQDKRLSGSNVSRRKGH